MPDLTQQLRMAASKRFGVFHLAQSLRKSKQKGLVEQLDALTNSPEESIRHAAEECLEWVSTSRNDEVGWGYGFSVGGVGIAGVPSWQYRACVRKIKRPDGRNRLERDLADTDKIWQLYALLGLSVVDRTVMGSVLPRFLSDYSPIAYQSGCLRSERPVREIASEIAHGRWQEIVVQDRRR